MAGLVVGRQQALQRTRIALGDQGTSTGAEHRFPQWTVGVKALEGGQGHEGTLRQAGQQVGEEANALGAGESQVDHHGGRTEPLSGVNRLRRRSGEGELVSNPLQQDGHCLLSRRIILKHQSSQ